MRFIASVLLGFVLSVLGCLSLLAVTFAQPNRTQILHEHALVLRPGSKTFETVPSGFEPDLAPFMAVVDGQIFVTASELGDRYAAVRWNGTAFEPTRPPQPKRMPDAVRQAGIGHELPGGRWVVVSFDDFEAPTNWQLWDGSFRPGPPIPPRTGGIDEVAALPGGMMVMRTGLGRLFVGRVSDAEMLPVSVTPSDFAPRIVLAAGPDRALIVGAMEDTRTLFVDPATRETRRGPDLPAWTTLIKSDADGTVVALTSKSVEVFHPNGLILAAALGGSALVGLVGVVISCARGHLSWIGAVIGFALGVGVSFVGLIALGMMFKAALGKMM